MTEVKQEIKQLKETKVSKKPNTLLPWSPWLAVLLIIVIYLLSQIVGSIFVYIISLVPYILHGTRNANNWLQYSVSAQFLYVLFAESFTVGSIYLFVKHYKLNLGSIGLHRPRWRDPLFGLLIIPVYLAVYIVMVDSVTKVVHGFNANQHQQIGFNSVHGPAQLIMTGISLCILAPIAEEIMFRGFLYTSLKKNMPLVVAAILTSLLFASAHLPEGGAAGPFWIGALDTFILSLFLIFLREKTKNLWASMTLHAFKNGIAFYVLYLTPLIHIHLF
jgi:membrane protease YdiL (CAAX protease family)